MANQNLSDLLASGSGGVPYPSGVPQSLRIPYGYNTSSAASVNRDWCQSFIARSDVTVDKLWWMRPTATAANVFLGLYDSAGNLLSDCAVDASTATGVHEVETTNFDLTQGELYHWMINTSAAVVSSYATSNSTSFPENQPNFEMFSWQHDPRMWNSQPTSPANLMGATYKTRTAATMPDPQTMTGWTASAVLIVGGFTAT